MPVVQRTPGRVEDFQRPHDAHTVGWTDLSGCGRIAAPKFAVQRLGALTLQSRSQAGANVGRNGRDSGEAVGQRLEIKAGAADENRPPMFPVCLDESTLRVGEPAPDGIIIGRIDVAVEAMRGALLLVEQWARRDDAQIAIDLHRIGIDNYAAEPLGERERQRRLAARGRPCDQHRRWAALLNTHGAPIPRLIAMTGNGLHPIMILKPLAMATKPAPLHRPQWRAP